MNPQIQEIFQPLHDALMSSEMDDKGVFDLIGGFAQTHPQIAYAMSYHMRDFIAENEKEQFAWNTAVAEVYRRTFFDEEHACKYGTSEMLEKGPKVMKQFVDYMTGNIKMDEQMLGRVFHIHSSAASH